MQRESVFHDCGESDNAQRRIGCQIKFFTIARNSNREEAPRSCYSAHLLGRWLGAYHLAQCNIGIAIFMFGLMLYFFQQTSRCSPRRFSGQASARPHLCPGAAGFHTRAYCGREIGLDDCSGVRRAQAHPLRTVNRGGADRDIRIRKSATRAVAVSPALADQSAVLTDTGK